MSNDRCYRDGLITVPTIHHSGTHAIIPIENIFYIMDDVSLSAGNLDDLKKCIIYLKATDPAQKTIRERIYARMFATDVARLMMIASKKIEIQKSIAKLSALHFTLTGLMQRIDSLDSNTAQSIILAHSTIGEVLEMLGDRHE